MYTWIARALPLIVTGLLQAALAAGRLTSDGSVTHVPCFVPDVAATARCVSLEVPLDWAHPEGRRLRIEAAIVPAVSGRPQPDPLIVLAGGPGQAASDYGAFVDTAFRDVSRQRDIVLFDQRGSGRSGALRCELPGDALTGFQTPAMRAALEACGERLGADAVFYTLADVVRDLEALRVALGWERVNLWGGSFGTRTAQHYIRALPITRALGRARWRHLRRDAALPDERRDCAGGAHRPRRCLHRRCGVRA